MYLFGLNLVIWSYLVAGVARRVVFILKYNIPSCDGCLGENGYMYMYGWVTLLSTWNCHNIVNQLHSNRKLKKKFLRYSQLKFSQLYFKGFVLATFFQFYLKTSEVILLGHILNKWWGAKTTVWLSDSAWADILDSQGDSKLMILNTERYPPPQRTSEAQ